ncbi:hypothetical protein ABT039_22815 [Streptomyces lasiicapitis]|uniref:hypothetical protein n=1 Tax=Streptomyces lasiicapitis TaxID=1923961 RepID=UPI00332D3924
MNASLNSRPRTGAERVALAYRADVHPAVRPLLDAIALLHGYEPKDRKDLAQLLTSLGGDTTGTTNAVAEIGELVKDLARHPVTGDLPRAELAFARQHADEYGEIVLQGEGEDTMNQLVHALEEHPAPGTTRVACAMDGGR